MEEALNFIEDCAQSYNCYYNLGDKNMMGKKQSYTKPAIEKFIFNKIFPIMYELYNKKYEKDNEIFKKKQEKINTTMNYNTIMEALEVSFLI